MIKGGGFMSYIESEVLELKREFTSDIAKEIIAMVNTKGGRIIIGVDDEGNIFGVENAKQVCESLSSLINDSIKPDITTMVSISTKIENNKELVIINISRGTNRPYYLSGKGLKPTGVFIRLANTSIPANENAIRQMIVQTDGTGYENIRSFNQDLHFEYAKSFFLKQGLTFEIPNMKTLGIINNDGLFTNLALLLSDECQHTIKIAVFEDTTKNRFLDRKEFSGSVLKQLSDVYDYLELNNKKRSTYDGLTRIDNNDYDGLVLRESLLNSIIHRDYSFSGSIIINVYIDRVEFVSIGGLVPGISIDDIMIGISQTRNEKLANIFYRLELVESYGTGIKKIIESYQKTAFSPLFKVTSGAFLLTLPNRNYRSLTEPVKEKIIQENIMEENIIKEKMDEIYGTELEGDNSNLVLNLLSKNRLLSRKEIQERLNMRQTSCLLLLKKLEEADKIKRIGQGKNVKYKL